MKYYKIEYINSEGRKCSDEHVPETVRIMDNPAVTITDVKVCDCDKCLYDAFEKLQKIRELMG